MRFKRLSRLFVGLSLCLGCGPSETEQLQDAVRSGPAEARHVSLRKIADLERIDPALLPELVAWSRDDDPDVRRLAALTLGRLLTSAADDATLAETIRAALIERLGDDVPAVRMSAAFAALNLDPLPDEAREIILAAMQNGDGGVIDRIGKTTPPPAWAIPPLIEILKSDARPGIRRLAATALGRLAPDRPDVVAALQAATSDPDDRVRTAAGEALGRRE